MLEMGAWGIDRFGKMLGRADAGGSIKDISVCNPLISPAYYRTCTTLCSQFMSPPLTSYVSYLILQFPSQGSQKRAVHDQPIALAELGIAHEVVDDAGLIAQERPVFLVHERFHLQPLPVVPQGSFQRPSPTPNTKVSIPHISQCAPG